MLAKPFRSSTRRTVRRPSNPIPGAERRTRIYDREAAPWPELSDLERSAEKLAVHFGLGYLSAEGIAKLAGLLAWVRPTRWSPPVIEHPPDLIKPPPSDEG